MTWVVMQIKELEEELLRCRDANDQLKAEAASMQATLNSAQSQHAASAHMGHKASQVSSREI